MCTGFKWLSGISSVFCGCVLSRLSSKEEPVLLLKKVLVLRIADQLCGNPDCGLQTRPGEETKKARIEMPAAAKVLREYVG
ncbi:hypothetical protein [Pedobacter gandavensis]|uniref:hypothetical protein n=1 Tax=Pedobacter gandavensis TaxID=2679963 RepID=UPI003D7C195F